MPKIKVTNTRSSQAERVGQIIKNAADKLSDFCTNRLTEIGLITSKFNFRFEFNSNKRNFVKSANRLISVIKRRLISENPYLEQSLSPFIQICDPSFGPFMIVDLKRPNEKVPYALRHESSSVEQLLMDKTKLLDRYVRFLNHLCKKYRVPCKVVAHLEIQRYDELEANEPVSVSYRRRVYVEMGTYYSPGNWVSYPCGEGLRHEMVGNPLSEESRYIPPEALFVWLPELMICLKTLNRETEYDYTAFGVEHSESA